MPEPAVDTILVLDFGGQTCQLIARRIRECGVYSRVLPGDIPLAEVDGIEQVRGIVLSGSPASVHDEGAPAPARDLLRRGVPVLGICYGMQHMMHRGGGVVSATHVSEYGRARVERVGEVAAVRRHPGKLSLLDEPRRCGRADRGRVSPGGRLRIRRRGRGRVGRCNGASGVRHPVPSGGIAHRIRKPHSRQLRHRDLRRPPAVESDLVRAARGGRGTRRRGRRAGRADDFRGRRLHGGGGVAAQGAAGRSGAPAVCRHRADAPAGDGGGASHPAQPRRHPRAGGRRGRPVLRRARWRNRSRDQAAHHRRPVHRGAAATRYSRSAATDSWLRARCIPT